MKGTLMHLVEQIVARQWQAKRCQGGIPARKDIVPQQMEGALDHMFLLSYGVGGLARFRVIGQELQNLMGMDPRGMPIQAVFNDTCRPEVAKAMHTLFSSPLHLHMAARIYGTAAPAQMRFWPLNGPHQTLNRAIGTVIVQAPPALLPAKLVLKSTKWSTIEGLRVSSRAFDKELAESAAPFHGKPQALRLIHSRD
jgi:hypothetical protein